MSEHTLKADYVIAGAGAVGLAFADTLLRESAATILLVDRRARPGGHWNDAYPFVRLHSPSATYGVESMPLGTGRIDETGLNRGMHELASGAEICAYYERVLQEGLLPSGRVTWLSMHEVDADGIATSVLDGSRRRLVAGRRWVDATQADTQVPATHPPRFAIADGVRCVTPSELTRLGEPAHGHVIVGGGKTAMDTVLWLLEQGVDPDAVTWIRPRDSWLLNRAHVQPTLPFAHGVTAALAAEMEAARDAVSLDDLFVRLEAARLLQRIDPDVQPTMYHCAILSEAELDELRRVRQVVRLGHVRSIERDRIVLDGGEVATSPGHVHVHCSAGGLPRGPAQPMFQGPRIVPQYVRRCSPTFSASFVAHLELGPGSDDEKNALCEPVSVPDAPRDWLRMYLQTARNQQRWSQRRDLQDWLRQSRLEAFSRLFEQASRHADPAWTAQHARLRAAQKPGLARIAELMAETEPGALGALRREPLASVDRP